MMQEDSSPHSNILMILSVVVEQDHGIDTHKPRDTWLVPNPPALIRSYRDVCPCIPLTVAERAYQIIQEVADT